MSQHGPNINEFPMFIFVKLWLICTIGTHKKVTIDELNHILYSLALTTLNEM